MAVLGTQEVLSMVVEITSVIVCFGYDGWRAKAII